MRNNPLRFSAAWPYLMGAAVIALVAGLIFVRPVYQRAQLEQNLSRAARMMQIGYASHIELAQFTDFDWTEVHVFAPYTTEAQIEAAIDAGWTGSKRIESSDSITLLVFMSGDRITRWVEVNRGTMDFAAVAGESPFTPETARFVMLAEGDPKLTLLR